MYFNWDFAIRDFGYRMLRIEVFLYLFLQILFVRRGNAHEPLNVDVSNLHPL